MKFLTVILFFLVFTASYCQETDNTRLKKLLVLYENADTDSLKNILWVDVINEFEKNIQAGNFHNTQNQNRLYDKNQYELSIINISQYTSESNRFICHRISKGFSENWNYVTQKKKDNTYEIILKEEDSNPFYTEIHDLNDNTFLLFTKYIDMSFSCYSAYVMKVENNGVTRQDAFKNKQDVLSVCSWTNIDESYWKNDPKTGVTTLVGGMAYYNAIPILFHSKNKTISYTFYSPEKRKEITRKASFKKGGFNIDSYDARNFEE